MKTGNLLGGLESPKFSSPQLAPPSPSFAGGFTKQQSRGASPAPGAQVIRARQDNRKASVFLTTDAFLFLEYQHDKVDLPRFVDIFTSLYRFENKTIAHLEYNMHPLKASYTFPNFTL